MAGGTILELNRSRSIGEMLKAAVSLYLRIPALFLALAAIVVVPYQLIVLLITHAGPLALGQLAFLPRQLIIVTESFLVTPLVSALHVHAVREVGEGGRPGLLSTIRRSMPRLLVVTVAAGLSSVAITVGTFVLVPGLFLLAMWAVVAQAAALERGSWIDAFRRSVDLTRGYRWHALGLIIAAAMIAGVPQLLLQLAFRHTTTTVALFFAGTLGQVLVRSFEALVTALLYFDLGARVHEPRNARRPTATRALEPKAPRVAGDPLTPDGYTDEDRPQGWYIDLDDPGSMRYWLADGAGAWSERTAKTPKATLAEWRRLRGSEPK